MCSKKKREQRAESKLLLIMMWHLQYSRRTNCLVCMRRCICSADLHTLNAFRENGPRTLSRPSPTSITLSTYSNVKKLHLIGPAHICCADLPTLIAFGENAMTTSSRRLQTSTMRSTSSLLRNILLNGHFST